MKNPCHTGQIISLENISHHSVCGPCGCAHSHEHTHAHAHEGGQGTYVPVSIIKMPGKEKNSQTWHIPDLDCPVEEGMIRKALADTPGIQAMSFHYSSRSMTIYAPEEVRENARKAIQKAGFYPQDTAVQNASGESGEGHHHVKASTYWRLGGALVLAVLVEVLSVFAPQTLPFKGLTLLLAVATVMLAGLTVYINGVRALVNRRLNINALMVMAVTGACILGQWAEAAMVMVLYSIAEHIEAIAVDRARNAISRLLNLTTTNVELKMPDGSWQSVEAPTVKLGQTFRVKPGERIPLDGTIRFGFSEVNQMAITGESIPVSKTAGDMVFAGSINESGILEVDVTALSEDTVLARIINAVEQVQEAKAPTQRFVDRFAAVYTPIVVLISLSVAVLMPLLAGWSWWDATYRALVLLVIACPCALVIATPLTVVSGLATAARSGIIVKGGVYLEEARKLKAIAFDKTGTITEGHPALIETDFIADGFSREEIDLWGATLASHSSHPISRAILAGLAEKTEPGTALDFTELPGRGCCGIVAGQKMLLGSARWMKERGLILPEISRRLEYHEKSGRSITVLATESEVLALYAVADRIRSSSREAIQELSESKIISVMLTGDNTLTAKAIASEVGINDIRSELLPDEKLLAVKALKEQYGHVGMTGDGINDAPALAISDIGIAMGGTDIAMETADVVIMNSDVRRVVDLIRLSVHTHRVLVQNIVIALGIKFVFFGLALTGCANMWMAVFADVGATLIVVVNGLRLLRWQVRPGGSN